MPTAKSFCRFCHANCAIEVDLEAGRAVAVRGDVANPLFGGYTCMKGRELPAQTYDPQRLLHSGSAALPRRPVRSNIAINSALLRASAPRASNFSRGRSSWGISRILSCGII